MLIGFFHALKAGGLPVSVKEYLTLCEALKKGVIHGNIDEFYYLSRTCMVKDESHFDRFDRAFANYFKGVAALDAVFPADIPEANMGSSKHGVRSFIIISIAPASSRVWGGP